MKHKLLKMANELNELLLHSKINGYIQFYRFEDGVIAIYFTHIHKSYEHNNTSIHIYDFNNEECILEKTEKIKRVIAGEAYLNE